MVDKKAITQKVLKKLYPKLYKTKVVSLKQATFEMIVDGFEIAIFLTISETEKADKKEIHRLEKALSWKNEQQYEKSIRQATAKEIFEKIEKMVLVKNKEGKLLGLSVIGENDLQQLKKEFGGE